MKIAVLMDPISELNLKKDTTLALMKYAQALNHEVMYFTPQDWYCREGEAYAQMSSIQIKKQVVTELQGEFPLGSFDVILMRQNPPVDTQYLYASFALELAEKKGVIVSNNPQSVRDTNEKFSLMQFPQCIPPTFVSQDRKRLRAFWESYQSVVFKPLNAMGGHSVCYVDEVGSNLAVILDLLTHNGTQTIMAQQYIPEIKISGDKRILMIHGEAVPYALARMPAAGDWRGNLAAGAQGEVVALTERDKALCKQVAPFLKAKGLHFVGLDVIGEWMTEINVTSPTCLCEVSEETGLDLAGLYWKGIEKLRA